MIKSEGKSIEDFLLRLTFETDECFDHFDCQVVSRQEGASDCVILVGFAVINTLVEQEVVHLKDS
jgi:hypothetical protein